MRPLIIILALIFSIFTIACEDRRIPPLEKRVSDLEAKMKQFDEEKTKAADTQSQKDFLFKACIDAAIDDYAANIRLNGTKSGTSYSLATTALRELEHHKQQKIEECKLLYH